MHVTVNGTRLEIAEDATIGDVLGELEMQPEHVAAEHNGEIVEPEELATRTLRASDRLEIVCFVGGG